VSFCVPYSTEYYSDKCHTVECPLCGCSYVVLLSVVRSSDILLKVTALFLNIDPPFQDGHPFGEPAATETSAAASTSGVDVIKTFFVNNLRTFAIS
jgi:hypothetical protein